MNETHQLQVTLLANAGIMLQFKKVKFLIDGIHQNKNGIFSGLSEKVFNDLLAAEKPLFKNIDYLLFTHYHPDHFSAHCTEKFLEKNHIKGLFMPDRPTMRFNSLREKASSQAEQTWLLDLPLEQKKEIKLTEDISLTVFRTLHIGKRFTEVNHFCYLFNFNEKKILIVADSNYDVDYFSRILAGEKIDVFFVIPLYVSKSQGRKVINEAVKPKRLVIYHIPFADEDKNNMRRLVRRNIERHKNNLPPLDILWDELQEITF